MKTRQKKREEEMKDTGKRIMMLKVDRILPNPAQPRKFFTDEAIMHLADSIRIHGIIQPLCVRLPEKGSDVYELVAGERRLRAAKRLGMEEVPCITVEADSTQSAHMAIVENIQRENLNMFEQAEAIRRLMEVHCLTQEKIAGQLSCSQSYVANKLRLLRLNGDERERILTAALSERHARALLRLKDGEVRDNALRTVIRRSMNVAATEEYVDKLIEAEKSHKEKDKDQRKTKLVVKDVRILYNTIDRAVETVRLSGIDVQTLRRETLRDTEIVIKIPKYA